jgi:hypothetical protein
MSILEIPDCLRANVEASESVVTQEEIAMLMDRRKADRTEHWCKLERSIKLMARKVGMICHAP